MSKTLTNEGATLTTENIQRVDLTPLLAASSGNHAFVQALDRITNNKDLLRVLGNYIHFNSVFGGGVANLAGEIAVRQDLFLDLEEPVEITADRSVEIAASIFLTAIEEFNSRGTPHRGTHRYLAQVTLKAAGRFFGYDLQMLNGIVMLRKATLATIRQVLDGYAVSQVVDQQKLFRAVGFHLGSELLADQEFSILDGFLRARHPDLVDYMEHTSALVDGAHHTAYTWIYIHTKVEAHHFELALKGANSAIRYYIGQESKARIKWWILEGFREFVTVQAAFMEHLIDD